MKAPFFFCVLSPLGGTGVLLVSRRTRRILRIGQSYLTFFVVPFSDSGSPVRSSGFFLDRARGIVLATLVVPRFSFFLLRPRAPPVVLLSVSAL